jgi:hypothetical protein
MLVSGAITDDGAAIVATDVRSGRLLWCDNYPAADPLRDHPTSVATGRFGPAGAPTVSVAWSSGRLTLHDAGRGTRPFASAGEPDNPVRAQRFVAAEDGRHYLAVRRHTDAAVLAPGPWGQLREVRSARPEGLAAMGDDLAGGRPVTRPA